MEETFPHRPRAWPVGLAVTVLALAWDATRWDLALASRIGTPAGFPLRDHWLLADVLHRGAHALAVLFAVATWLAVWWPIGPLRRLPAHRRWQLALSASAAAMAVSLLKSASTTSCPWDLVEFGGAAHHVSHWSGLADGGGGHCFPAGHASSGFSFLAGFFAWRDVDAGVARAWLAAALMAGLVLGLAQQWRGAHFMSHTLWTAVACWWTAWTIDRAWARRRVSLHAT